MFTQRGEVCSPYENVTSLPGGIKTKKLSEFHQISKLWDFRPQEWLTQWLSITLMFVHKTKRILVVTMELSIIWHIASAFNLAQS